MPLFPTRRHQRTPITTTTTHHGRGFGARVSNAFRGNGRTHHQNRVAGLKAARTNPNTTSAGRRRAKMELKASGVRPNRVPISTRIRHFFRMGGSRSRRV
ncbi:hypothetical protein RQP46_010415 [Phenoliferia psychrophenolica]